MSRNKRQMRRPYLAILLLLGVVAVFAYHTLEEQRPFAVGSSLASRDGVRALRQAYRDRLSHVEVEGEGVVVKLLPEDLRGIRHQRFILAVGGNHTVLIAHNIDLAPRIVDLKIGDVVAFKGEYEWNARGGVVHWTHRAPKGRHVGGWLRRAGRMYH